jgi:putative ABC transport system permease protein
MNSIVPPLLFRAGINYLFRHPWQLLLALTGISMGVTLVLAVDIANSAAKASFEHASEQVRGTATHRIVNDLDRLDEAIYANLFRKPGMPPIAPVVSTKVQIEGYEERFQLIGMDILAEANFRRSLVGNMDQMPGLDQWLTDPEAVMISRSTASFLKVKVSDRIHVKHLGKSFDLEVKAISELESDSSRGILLVDIATAQRISDRKKYLSYIDVLLENHAASDIESLLPESVKLVDISQQTESILGLSAAFELNLTAMSLLGMLVGVFLIYNAISFSVVQRRNLLGRLRSLGVTSAQIYILIMLEAIVLGVLGTIIGILLGTLLGQQLTSIVAATISELYYDVNAQATSVYPVSLLKAGLVGIVGTLAAAWIPALQASRTKPLTTLSRAALEQSIHRQMPFLALAGTVLVLTGFLVSFLVPGNVITGFIGLFVIVIGFVLTIPLLLSRLSRLLSTFSGNLIWQMSVKDLDRHISRLATATAALMLALSTSIGIAIMVDSMRVTVEDWLADLLTGDLYIAAQGFEDNAYLSAGTIENLIDHDAVSDYSLYRNYKIRIGDKKRSLVAARLSPKSKKGFDFFYADREKVWAAFDQGAVIISEPLAYRLQLDTGDSISLLTLKGEREYEVAGIFRDFASEHGRLFMPIDEFQKHWQDKRINTMALFSNELSPEQLESKLYGLVQTSEKIIITRTKDVIEESMAIFGRTFRITEVLRLLSIFVAFVGIFSALMAILLERKKEFAILRAVGLTQSQISQLILVESIMLGLIAALLAVPVGLAMAWVLTDVIQYRAFGWSMPFQFSLEPIVVANVMGCLAALIAAIYPAWLASRRNPAPMLRED